MTETPNDRQEDGSRDTGSQADCTAPTNDQIALPRYVVRRADGLYVVLQAFDSASHFSSFLDRIFAAGMRFANLDYDALSNLLYQWGIQDVYKLARDLEAAGKPALLRLASDIVPFPPQRQKYYRNVKLIEGGDAAQYLFEPILAEPAPAESADVEGEALHGASQPETSAETVQLDIDEFIAAMWCKNVRFGIDIATVKEGLHGTSQESLVIARMKAPTEGLNATVEEMVNSLHRSNAPKLLADGRVDLHQFQNRFPQMEKNTKLVRKVPRVAGKPGWSLAGKEISPNPPQDFDIATLAGPGTRVDRSPVGEFIVADIAGFLQIDAASHSFSIADKIVNREGVNQRTTGNLVLTGDEYEEHGIVEEHASVEGKHMTFMADVFGDLVSRSGRVVLKTNLVGGSINNPGGTITVEGNASRASLEAKGGVIVLQYAESCRIVGARVQVEKAVHCDILAQELTIGSAEGCALAAPKIQVGSSTDRHDVETLIAILVPDMSAFIRQLDELKRLQADCDTIIKRKRAELETLSSQQEIKTYQLLSAKLRANELTMTPEQQNNWQKLLSRVTPILKRLKSLSDDMREASGINEQLTQQIDTAERETASAARDIACNVAEINGETTIRTLIVRPNQPALETLPARELHARLRESGTDSVVLFSDSSGEFDWKWSAEA